MPTAPPTLGAAPAPSVAFIPSPIWGVCATAKPKSPGLSPPEGRSLAAPESKKPKGFAKDVVAQRHAGQKMGAEGSGASSWPTFSADCREAAAKHRSQGRLFIWSV